MRPLLIYGGRIIAPGRGIDEIASLLIADGNISWLGREGSPLPRVDYDALDARGLIICPGLLIRLTPFPFSIASCHIYVSVSSYPAT